MIVFGFGVQRARTFNCVCSFYSFKFCPRWTFFHFEYFAASRCFNPSCYMYLVTLPSKSLKKNHQKSKYKYTLHIQQLTYHCVSFSSRRKGANYFNFQYLSLSSESNVLLTLRKPQLIQRNDNIKYEMRTQLFSPVIH